MFSWAPYGNIILINSDYMYTAFIWPPLISKTSTWHSQNGASVLCAFSPYALSTLLVGLSLITSSTLVNMWLCSHTIYKKHISENWLILRHTRGELHCRSEILIVLDTCYVEYEKKGRRVVNKASVFSRVRVLVPCLTFNRWLYLLDVCSKLL